MTIEQMHERFDLIQDKYESPYFTANEKDHFINLAQNSMYLKLDFTPFEYVGQQANVSRSFESSEFNSQHLKPFIIEGLDATPSTGVVTNDNLNSLIQSYTGDNSDEVHRVISVSVNGEDVRWVRHNDLNRFRRNKYLEPNAEYPVFTYSDKGITIEPHSNSCKVSVLRKHRDVSHENSISSEFPEHLHYKILYDALMLSGIPVKDFEMSALKEYDRSI